MCKYCERRTDIKHGWNQPKLPYHGNLDMCNLSGNIADFEDFEGVIHDYKTTSPQLILTCHGYWSGTGVGTVYIPIKYCPECGRKLGKSDVPKTNVGNNGWIPVGERMPEDNRPVLCWVRSTTIACGETYIIGLHDSGCWFLQTYEIGHHHFPVKDYEVIAWQPLLEPLGEK